jgi:hypothetical protein
LSGSDRNENQSVSKHHRFETLNHIISKVAIIEAQRTQTRVDQAIASPLNFDIPECTELFRETSGKSKQMKPKGNRKTNETNRIGNKWNQLEIQNENQNRKQIKY